MSEDKIQETIDKYKRCVCWMALLSAELVDAELMNNAENLKAYDTLTKAISDAAHGPVDADGETWHVGDMSDSPSGAIEEIDYADGLWRVRGHGVSPWVPADILRHYHEPTLERLLGEYGQKSFEILSMGESTSPLFNAALTHEYAEKLRKLLKEES